MSEKIKELTYWKSTMISRFYQGFKISQVYDSSRNWGHVIELLKILINVGNGTREHLIYDNNPYHHQPITTNR